MSSSYRANILRSLNYSGKSRVPVILQSEAAECGLCCMLMIASYHGYKSSLVEERRLHNIPSRGMNMHHLSLLAEDMKLIARGLKVSLEQLQLISLPCILHWNMNHFVVLKEIKKGHVVIHNPSIGEQVLSKDELSKSFTGIALELLPSNDFKCKISQTSLKISQLWTKSTGIKKHLSIIVILSAFIEIFSVVSPFYLQVVIDSVVVNNNVTLLSMLAICFSIFLGLKLATEYIRSSILLHFTSNLNLHLSMNIFQHLMRLPISYFGTRHIGDVISKFRSIDEIRDILSNGLIKILLDSVMSILTLVMMSIYNIKLTLAVVIIILLYAALRYISYSKLRELNQKSIIAHANEHSNFMETLRSIQSIKIYKKENYRENQWLNKYVSAMNIDIQLDKWQIKFTFIQTLIFGLGNIGIIFFAAKLLLNDLLSLGMLYAFLSYKDQFATKMASLIDDLVKFKMVGLHLERISDIALTQIEKETNQLDKSLQLTHCIDIDNLSYRYSEYDDYLFKGLSFNIIAGESVAIVGPSGCGKTTLLKCLMGLLEAEEGDIKVDGIKLKNFTGYRNQISAVMQEDTLLSGSIIENITFFDPNYDFDRIVECTKLAAVHEDITAMPMQYHTMTGDMGISFSGGQIQRILLARALYMNPKILFLDEATSNLDANKESIINANIKNLNITRIIIAHRKETINSADRIIDLRDFIGSFE